VISGAIPIKRESKRFPGKNFMMLNRKHLITLAIQRLVPNVDRIIISTDAVQQVHAIIDPLEISIPVEVIARREEATNPELPSNKPIAYALTEMALTWSHEDLVVMTQVTTPLIREQTIARCIAKWHNAKNNNLLVTVNPDFKPNGGAYLFRPQHVLGRNSLYEGNVGVHVVPWQEGIDIDYQHQLAIAAAIDRGTVL
jgi:CMP-N-acetylneuraminic acid synthetase